MVPVLDQFILSLRDSRLIPAEELVSLQKALQGSRTPHSVEDVVKMLVKNGRLTEYQATTIAQGRPQSLILGEYVLLSILGKGGMGVVFRARHRLMDREVALKTLSTVAIKPDTVPRFYREVKAAARLSHPNIVTAYDAGEQAGTHYLVMEYVRGRDLAAIVKEKGPLPLRQAIDYVQQAARGLEFAHKHGVVHRDVKPSNLLLDQEGVVKILDMGLARLSENLAGTPEATDITGTGQILGTVDYMSPEQAEDMRSADHRSDIYSLGCTLFYLLTRRPVFGGETVLRRILCHRTEPIPSLMDVRPDCPEALDALAQWMLAKQPEDRPQGMVEVIAVLEGCMEKPDAAPPLAVPTSDAPAPSRNWLEDLSQEEPAGNTANSQVLEATAGSPPIEEPFSVSQFASKSGSTKGRPKQQTHRPAAKKTAPPTPGRWSWKIVAAAIAAAVIVVAAVTALMISPTDSGTAKKGSAGTAKLGGVSAQPAGSMPDRPGQAAWEEAWANAKAQADRHVAQRQFAKAIHEYTTVAGLFQDFFFQQRCNEAIRGVEAEADAAFVKLEADARKHLQQRQYDRARAALQPALTTFGLDPLKDRAKKVIAEIDRAEKPVTPQAEKPVEVFNVVATPAGSAELTKQRQQDAAFAKAVAAVEGRVAAWDFRGAIQTLEKLHFDAPELTARAAGRREQIRRMADLKDRMIAAINQADPPLKKADLALRGINGDINKADALAITAKLANGKDEPLIWSELGPKSVQKLLQLVMRRDDGGDWLAAGLFSLTGQDIQTAERCFDKAQSLGTDTASSKALLATREFARVQGLLDKQKYAESQAILTALEEKYGNLPWFSANKAEFAAAAKEAKRGLREKDAERLFAQAASLFRNGDLYELKPLVERLKTQYADSTAAADPQRKPSLDELAKAVADLGPLVIVRKDGKGDAKTIQEAVKMAAGNATIRIEEAGPWSEQITIPTEKDSLTICGKRGVLPVLTTAGAANNYSENLLVRAPRLSLERLAIVRADAGGPTRIAISAENASLSFRGVVVYGHVQAGKDGLAKGCVFFGKVGFEASSALQDVVVSGGDLNCGNASQLRHCTITGQLHLAGTSSTVSDCIVSSIDAANDSHTIEHCDAFGENPYVNQATPGKGRVNAPPQFADAKNSDFRLLPGSPCRKAASDGGDMGFTFTPENQALLKAAADLYNRAHSKL